MSGSGARIRPNLYTGRNHDLELEDRVGAHRPIFRNADYLQDGSRHYRGKSSSLEGHKGVRLPFSARVNFYTDPKSAAGALDVVDDLEIKPAPPTVATHQKDPLADGMAEALLDDCHTVRRVGSRRQTSRISGVIVARRLADQRIRVNQVLQCHVMLRRAVDILAATMEGGSVGHFWSLRLHPSIVTPRHQYAISDFSDVLGGNERKALPLEKYGSARMLEANRAQTTVWVILTARRAAAGDM